MLVRFGVSPVVFKNVITSALKVELAIQKGVAIRNRLREGFSQLLHDPIGRRMPGNVEVQDPTAPVLDDEQTVQHSEGRGRHSEEVEGDDGLAVVAEKRQPFLARIAGALGPSQILNSDAPPSRRPTN